MALGGGSGGDGCRDDGVRFQVLNSLDFVPLCVYDVSINLIDFFSFLYFFFPRGHLPSWTLLLGSQVFFFIPMNHIDIPHHKVRRLAKYPYYIVSVLPFPKRHFLRTTRFLILPNLSPLTNPHTRLAPLVPRNAYSTATLP